MAARMFRLSLFRLGAAVLVILTAAFAHAAEPVPAEHPAVPYWFNRYVTHWGEMEPDFVEYVRTVRPQMVQAGFWGGEYYSGVSYAREKGVAEVTAGIGGGRVDLAERRRHIAALKEAGARVIGHFSLTMVYGDAEKSRGWFAAVDRDWDEALLGPRVLGEDGKPVAVADLMQRTSKGLAARKDYAVEGGSEYWACPANPQYRQILKRFVKVGIDSGLDGFMIVFPHREDCICPHCQAGFKEHLRRRYSAEQIRETFGIADLDGHVFDSITGYFEAKDASPLKLESLKFTQLLLRDCLREVFLEYGRSLKPDLMVGQWNHLYRSSMSGPGQLAGTFAQLNADERCTLPSDLWARGENWVWYSIGNWSMYWKPEEKKYAQFSLEHRWLRACGGGLPQAIKRDDNVNVAVYLAEAVGHGGFAYARGVNYKDPQSVAIVRRYFDFLRQHEDLYRPEGRTSYAEVALVWPRGMVHQGDLSSLSDFTTLGETLTRAHVSYDVVVDDQVGRAAGRYRMVLEPKEEGGNDLSAEPFAGMLRQGLIEAPEDVVATAWRQAQPHRLQLHVVHYTAHLPPEKAGKPADYQPPTSTPARLRLPAGAAVKAVRLLSPDFAEKAVAFKSEGGFVTFDLGVLPTYVVAVVDLE